MALKWDHLEGLEFDLDRANCYQLIRRFYKDNYDIELTDYACPTDWFDSSLDLFARLANDEGFEVLHCNPRDYRAGDVVIMALKSSTGNHSAVLLPTGQLLHHLVGQRSSVTPYAGVFRHSTIGVYRCRDVPEQPEMLVELKDVLPPHVRRRFEELEAQRAAAADAAAEPVV